MLYCRKVRQQGDLRHFAQAQASEMQRTSFLGNNALDRSGFRHDADMFSRGNEPNTECLGIPAGRPAGTVPEEDRPPLAACSPSFLHHTTHYNKTDMAGKKRSTTSNPSSSPSTSLRSLPSATSPPQQPATSTPVKIPVSIRKPPTKVPLLKRWWLFYEGSFALSMLETVSLVLRVG